ncbi:MAG: hypothetical protein AAF402_02990 [Pseudomonadota bacterium]
MTTQLTARRSLTALCTAFGLALTLTACGGGGSGSGGGSSSGFTGTQSIVISSVGTPIASEVLSIEVSISGSRVVISSDQIPAEGSVDGNSLVATSDSVQFTVNEIECTGGQVTYTGTFDDNSVSGDVSGPLVCNGIDFAISGTFQATST